MFRHDYRPVCWQLQLQHEQERNLHPAVHADGRGGPIVVRACVSVLWPLEQTARTIRFFFSDYDSGINMLGAESCTASTLL